jgi:NADPH:quinone reductase-like Zn-dependent oxidoreductase
VRAWQIVAHGQPPELAELGGPEVPAGAVLVEVTAAPITPLDVLTASGTSYFGPPALPYIPGVQGVGRVVDGGKRVWFTTDAGMRPGDGSLADRAAVRVDRMWPIPGDAADVADIVVAGLGLSAVAAHGALRRGRVAPGERILVLGAGGVVGRVAVQLARAWGAGLVVAACRGAEAAERARDLGADVAVDIAGMDADDVTAAFRAAAPDGVDLVVDPVWGLPAQAALATLAPGGRLVNLGDGAGASATFASAAVRSRTAEILGYTNLALTWTAQTDAMGEILRLTAEGRLRLEPEVVPMSGADEGWQRQAQRRNTSRVVVDLRR